MNQRERLAIHEAGRAVMQVLEDGAVDYVTITIDDIPNASDEGYDDWVHRACLVLMAGGLAELVILETTIPKPTRTTRC